MVYKQKQHLISFITKVLSTLVFLTGWYSIYPPQTTSYDTPLVATLVFFLFTVQIIAQTITTGLYALKTHSKHKATDERDTYITLKADQAAGYVLGVSMMIGLGAVVFGQSIATLLIILAVGGVAMGLVADSIKFNLYKA